MYKIFISSIFIIFFLFKSYICELIVTNVYFEIKTTTPPNYIIENCKISTNGEYVKCCNNIDLEKEKTVKNENKYTIDITCGKQIVFYNYGYMYIKTNNIKYISGEIGYKNINRSDEMLFYTYNTSILN